MDSKKSQKESCSSKAEACSFTAQREKLILVSPHKQSVQYLFIEQPDISVSPLFKLMTDSTRTGTNILRKHFMVHGELSTVILAEISEGHKYKPGFIKQN